MSIYVGAHRAKLCRGDWRPATLYKGGQYIAGAVDSAPVTLPGAIEDTYNDYVMLTALGKGRQDSTTGKNLFDENAEFIGGERVTITRDNGEIIITPIPDSATPAIAVSAFKTEIQKDGIYTISLLRKQESTHVETNGVRVYKNGNTIKYFAMTKTSEYIRENCSFNAVAGDEIMVSIYASIANVNAPTTRIWVKEIQIESGSTATDYEPYTGGMPSPNPEYPQPIAASGGTVTTSPQDGSTRQPTQITLPTLRAIPDGSGGWVARDSMTPVLHMPGWYDVVREIRQFELHSTDNIRTWGVSYATEGLTGFYWSYSGFSTPGLTTQCVCSHLPYAVGTWGGGVYGAQANKTYFIATLRNDMLSDVSSDDAAVASFKSLLDEYDAAGTPFSAWVALNAPTTERVYLGGLKSYPQYTYISADGDYPPDMTATAKFNREEQII